MPTRRGREQGGNRTTLSVVGYSRTSKITVLRRRQERREAQRVLWLFQQTHPPAPRGRSAARPLGSVRRMARSVVFRGEASQARDAAGTAASVAAAAVASSGAALAAVAEGNWEAPWGRLLPQSYLELALSECGLRDEHGRVCSRADRMAAFDHMGKHGQIGRAHV